MAFDFNNLEDRFSRLDVDNNGTEKSQLVIGIDFGTTYTGVAYSHSSIDIINSSQEWTIEQITDKVVAIKQWPNADPLYPEKAPTVLAYDNGTVVAWGGSVKRSHATQVSHFKLGLQEKVAQHYNTPGAALSVLGGFLGTENWWHPSLPGKLPVDFAADYLKAVREYVVEQALPRHLGKEFLNNQPIRYVITVPAIWSDKAKDLTRQAAARAGILETRLTLVTEPEAAALYCSTLCKEVNLNSGDRFLVCDAGGGTVDLIAYEIKAMHPFKIKECTIGTGATCGAAYLTRNFETFLSQRLGGRKNVLTKAMLANAVRSFEGAIKFQFDPFSNDCDSEFEVPLRGAPDMPNIGLEDGYLKVTRNDLMQHVFIPLFAKICDLVQTQIRNVESKHKKGIQVLFLVGGLGSNEFLAKYLKNRIKLGIVVKQPNHGHTAIMRGAVLYQLGLKADERVMRRHYGLRVVRLFRNGDPSRLKVVGNDGLDWCKDVMKWGVGKNDNVPDGFKVEDEYYNDDITEAEWDARPTCFLTQTLYSCEDDKAPEFFGGGIKELCVIVTDAKKLPRKALERKRSPQGFHYYKISYAISIHFNTTLEFRLKYDGKEYAFGKANYT